MRAFVKIGEPIHENRKNLYWFLHYCIAYLLLQREYVFIKVILYLLVGDIDAQLFERIFLEILESKNVQNAYR